MADTGSVGTVRVGIETVFGGAVGVQEIKRLFNEIRKGEQESLESFKAHMEKVGEIARKKGTEALHAYAQAAQQIARDPGRRIEVRQIAAQVGSAVSGQTLFAPMLPGTTAAGLRAAVENQKEMVRHNKQLLREKHTDERRELADQLRYVRSNMRAMRAIEVQSAAESRTIRKKAQEEDRQDLANYLRRMRAEMKAVSIQERASALGAWALPVGRALTPKMAQEMAMSNAGIGSERRMYRASLHQQAQESIVRGMPADMGPRVSAYAAGLAAGVGQATALGAQLLPVGNAVTPAMRSGWMEANQGIAMGRQGLSVARPYMPALSSEQVMSNRAVANAGQKALLHWSQFAAAGAAPSRLSASSGGSGGGGGGGGTPPTPPGGFGRGFFGRMFGSVTGTAFARGGFGADFMSGMSMMAGASVFNMAAMGISRLAGAVKDLYASSVMTASSVEQLQMRMNVLSGGQGRQRVGELYGLAKELKIPFMPMAETYSQLMAYGIKPGMGAYRNLLGYAMATGNMHNLGPIGLAISQISSKGKVEMQELRQLGERGIKWQDLVRKGGLDLSGMNIGDIGKEFIPSEKFLTALFKGMEEAANKGIAEYSKTWEAKVNEMKLAWFDFTQSLANSGFFDSMKSLLDQINRILTNPAVQQLAVGTGKAGVAAAEATQGLMAKTANWSWWDTGRYIGAMAQGQWIDRRNLLERMAIPDLSGGGFGPVKGKSARDMSLGIQGEPFSAMTARIQDMIREFGYRSDSVKGPDKRFQELMVDYAKSKGIQEKDWMGMSSSDRSGMLEKWAGGDQGLAELMSMKASMDAHSLWSMMADGARKIRDAVTEEWNRFVVSRTSGLRSMASSVSELASPFRKDSFSIMMQANDFLAQGVDRKTVMGWMNLQMGASSEIPQVEFYKEKGEWKTRRVEMSNEARAPWAEYGTAEYYKSFFNTERQDPKMRLQEEANSLLAQILQALQNTISRDLGGTVGGANVIYAGDINP